MLSKQLQSVEGLDGTTLARALCGVFLLSPRALTWSLLAIPSYAEREIESNLVLMFKLRVSATGPSRLGLRHIPQLGGSLKNLPHHSVLPGCCPLVNPVESLLQRYSEFQEKNP